MTCFPCLRRRRRESADQSRESGSVALPSEVFSASRPTLKEKISRISRPTLPSVEFSVPKITRPSLQGVNFRSFRGKGRDSRDSWNSSSVQIGISIKLHHFRLRKVLHSISLNRYRRGLETCPQAKTSKSGHAIFFSFFRRVRATSMTQRRVENTRVHFWTFSPVSVKYSRLS